MDEFIPAELVPAIDAFVQFHGHFAAKGATKKKVKRGSVDGHVGDLQIAKKLRATCAHVRDLSWRTLLTSEQGNILKECFHKLQPVLMGIIAAAGGTQSVGISDVLTAAKAAEGTEGNNPEEVSRVLRLFLLAFEASSLYLALANCCQVPAGIIIEELRGAVVTCLRQGIRLIVLPLLSPPVNGRKGNATSSNDASLGLLCSDEEKRDFIAATSDLMQSLHEFLCRHRIADDQLHQLVHASLSAFFTYEPHFAFCAAAEQLLVTIFARFDDLRSSVLQELLVRVPKLPNGKMAKNFKVPASDDDPEHGLSTWTRLFLRLVQSVCLPLHEAPGAETNMAMLLERRSKSQALTSQLVVGLLQRLLLQPAGAFAERDNRTLRVARDEDSRAILDEFVDELLFAAFRPSHPGAFALLHTLTWRLLLIVQPDEKTAGDVAVRESALKLLGKILTSLWHDHIEVARGFVQLPAWDQKPCAENRDGRLLQHVALRVSFDEGRKMPWSEAARAVEAWNAELFLPKGGCEGSGLSSLTDELVFMHLIFAFLQDECSSVSSRFVPSAAPSTPGATCSLSSAVFPSGHPAHAWSFLVCDWAELMHRKAKTQSTPEAARLPEPVEQFLSSAWTSKSMMGGAGCYSRSSCGRRAAPFFTVYKVYRQLRSGDLDCLRQTALDCIVRQGNAAQATLRRTAIRILGDMVSLDVGILSIKGVQDTVDNRLQDESSLVRKVSLDILGRVLEGGLFADIDGFDDDEVEEHREHHPQMVAPNAAAAPSGSDVRAKEMLLRFHKTVRSRINDTSILVRRQASKILSAFILSHPEHPDVVDVAHDLMRRSSDSEALRSHVLNTFELLWFMEEEPSAISALQLACVIEGASSMRLSPVDILKELLERFRQNVDSRKKSRGYEFAVRRWTTLLLNEFVSPTIERNCDVDGKTAEEQMRFHRRALLTTLESFAAAEPEAMIPHMRPLTIYLALDDGSASEEQWVAVKVCRIFISVLPKLTVERRGLLDHRQVQQDLQALIKNQSSSGVHAAVRCLCAVVTYITGDLGQVLVHLNTGIPMLSGLCSQAEASEFTGLDRVHLLYMVRQVWIVSSLLEGLNVDEYILHEPTNAADAASNPKLVLPRALLKFELIGGSVSATVSDLLARLFNLGRPRLQAVVVKCLGYFLRGQRAFVKDRKLAGVFAASLASPDYNLCQKALEALAGLLDHFSTEAGLETRPREGMMAPAVGGLTAIQAAQPLSAYGEAALSHLSLASGGAAAGLARSNLGSAEMLRLRTEALSVVRHLQLQGLINPMVVLPKVFSLCFSIEPTVFEQAATMLKDMLDVRPALLLNRMDEAFREAFLALHATGHSNRLGACLELPQLSAIGEIYSACFRRQKGSRDSFIRRALKEIFKSKTGRFHERFTELAAMTAVRRSQSSGQGNERPRLKRVGSICEGGANKKTPEAQNADPALSEMSLLQRHQLLYVQFAASVICSLPFAFEGEPLLVVLECNDHLSLQAGSFFAELPGADAPPRPADPELDGIPLLVSDTFGDAVSIVACVVLKKAIKAAYSLSDDMCVRFSPQDAKQERIKHFPAVNGKGAGAGSEEQSGTIRARWPAEEFVQLATPLVEHCAEPHKLVEHIKKLTEADPWDTTRGRYAAAVERLEGRTPAKRRRINGGEDAGAVGGRRGRGRGRGGRRGRAGPSGVVPPEAAPEAIHVAQKERRGRCDMAADEGEDDCADTDSEDFEDIG